MGYPVIPYAPGVHVRTSSRERLRPYQPLMPPPLNPPQMGGTGLSGLALAEDGDGIFQDAGGRAGAAEKRFFLANPITGTVQQVKAEKENGRHRWEKLPDFLTCEDRWFRPVAVHFGPDGALYVVDWYNKIISHNEVPREHPDRDKARGRIWRVRHRDQPRVTPPNLAALDDRALLAQLGASNALVARLAWLELTDRRANGVKLELEKIAADPGAAAGRRLGALWAREGIAPVETALLRTLSAETNPNLRREAVRIAAAQPRSEDEFLALVAPRVDDPDPAVRAAVGDALRRVPAAGPRVMQVAAALGREALATGGEGERYERDFERYLARWAMEMNPAATRALLDSPAGAALPLENRVLAGVAIGGRDGAVRVARLTRELARPLDGEEVRLLAAHFAEPEVRPTLTRALEQGASRPAVLGALLETRAGFDPAALGEALVGAVRAQLSVSNPAERAQAATAAGVFTLQALEPDLVGIVQAHAREAKHPVVLPALRALREMGSRASAVFEDVVRNSAEPALQDEALAALAAANTSDANRRLIALLPRLSVAQRGNALHRMSGTREGAGALLEGLRNGSVAEADLGVSSVDRLRTVLPQDGRVAELWSKRGGEAARALRLNGADGDFVATQFALRGPFTVECWVKLEAPISNHDGLLASPGQLDLNFHAGQFRVWVQGGAKNIVIAKKKTAPGVWTHYAVTRDAGGIFRIFINGELDATSTASHAGDFSALDVGRTTPAAGGTAGWLAEFRVWSEARSAREIRDHFDRSLAGEGAAGRPAALQHVLAGARWGALQGGARIEVVDDAPVLLTPAEATAQAEKFARFRALANTRGNPERGRELFSSICLACHQLAGRGGQLAPALDGVGHTGVEALLRNLLTPSAAMESAYQVFRVVRNDGGVEEGFLVEAGADAVVLRAPGAEERRIARREIREARYLRRSLMPDGLLEAMAPEQVTDLFAYLKSLR